MELIKLLLKDTVEHDHKAMDDDIFCRSCKHDPCVLFMNRVGCEAYTAKVKNQLQKLSETVNNPLFA